MAEKEINQLSELGSTKRSKALQAPLHDEKGNLTLEGIRVLRGALNSPVWHFSVDLGINKFKKFIKQTPSSLKGTKDGSKNPSGFTKSMINDQICRYKDKGWKEYSELVNHNGSFPTHNAKYCK